VTGPTAAPPPAPVPWGTCSFCGDAVPPNAKGCPTCGADRSLSATSIRAAPPRLKNRLRFWTAIRTLVLVGVVAVLAYSLLSVALQGPPVVADPLTTQGTYTIGAGNYSILTGDITGGDYVVGNFTSLLPSGASLDLAVYNESEFVQFMDHAVASPAYTVGPTSNGRIVYSAEYTDTYYFVFTNPYPVSSHVSVTAYITTQYESNVGDEGM
jgi:hypothetical protein